MSQLFTVVRNETNTTVLANNEVFKLGPNETFIFHHNEMFKIDENEETYKIDHNIDVFEIDHNEALNLTTAGAQQIQVVLIVIFFSLTNIIYSA